MRTRTIVLAIATAILAAGCSNPVQPFACDGNPKCKAEARPKLPSTLQPLVIPPGVRVRL